MTATVVLVGIAVGLVLVGVGVAVLLVGGQVCRPDERMVP